MEVIEIARDEVLADEDSVQDYVDLLNGIVWECANNFGFDRGSRNTVAVDLTVAAYMLGLDPIGVLDKLIDRKVIHPSDDDEDTHVRVKTVMDYSRRFSWEWMIDPDMYVDIARINKIADNGIMPVKFKLS